MIESFSNFGWTLPLKKENAQTIPNMFENVLITPKRKPNLFETDRGKEIVSQIVTDFLNRSYIQRYSRYTALGAFFGDVFNRFIRDLFKRTVFERKDGNYIDVLPTKTKQYNIRRHSY